MILTLEIRAERKRCSIVCLDHFGTTPNFFDRLVTADETWLYLYEPEMKYQSMEWKLPKEPSPKKTKASCSAVKVMLTVFWDAEGIILADFFACRHKHEQIVLFRSNKVSKTGIGKEKTKQIAKRTCPSPPRQCTAISVRRHHGNNRRMRPPTSGSSTLLP